MKNIKLAYIGGGSKLWPRSFMQNPALVQRSCANIDLTCEGIRERNADKLFDTMCGNTGTYLAPCYPQFC